MLKPEIIFQDNQLLVVNKPSGIVVNNVASAKEETIQEWVGAEFPLLEFCSRNGIVHRLDKETSGLLIIAKTPAALENLQAQFKQRLVKKTYLALVHGQVQPKTGLITAPVGRNPFNRHKFGVFPGGRPSQTRWTVSKYYKYHLPGGISPPAGDKLTFLELKPLTGRTHQIRVHLKYLDHPIVSDPLYLGRKQLKNDLKLCPRLFLHASQLSFQHPETNRLMQFKSQLPRDLEQATGELVLLNQ